MKNSIVFTTKKNFIHRQKKISHVANNAKLKL